MSKFTPSDFYRFVAIAITCSSYPEFSLEVVLRGHAELGTLDFYKLVVSPINCGTVPSVFGVRQHEYIDAAAIIERLRYRLLEIPWRSDYFAAKNEELKVSNITSL